MCPSTRRKNHSLQPLRKTSTSLPTPGRMHQAPPKERRNHTRSVTGALGLHHPGHQTPQAAKSQGKCSLSAKDHDTEEHRAPSSKHKDRSHSDKSSKCRSDKEGSSTPCKHALSSPLCAGSRECPQKEPHVEKSSHVPSEGPCINYRSLSRSMSELKDHECFTTHTSSSTPYKSRPSSNPDQALLTAGSPPRSWMWCSTKSLVSVAPLVSSEVEPLPCPVLLGLVMCPAPHGSLLD